MFDEEKRQIWLEVRRRIQTGENSFICNQLRKVCQETYGIELSPHDLQTFFPEFENLYDGYGWYEREDFVDRTLIARTEAWWTESAVQARLKCIDLILSNLDRPAVPPQVDPDMPVATWFNAPAIF